MPVQLANVYELAGVSESVTLLPTLYQFVVGVTEPPFAGLVSVVS